MSESTEWIQQVCGVRVKNSIGFIFNTDSYFNITKRKTNLRSSLFWKIMLKFEILKFASSRGLDLPRQRGQIRLVTWGVPFSHLKT